MLSMEGSLKMSMKKLALAVLGLALSAGTASAAVQVFNTPGGATAGGEPVSAQATFTPGAGTLHILLENLQADPKAVIQNISDLFFQIDLTDTGSLTGSAGDEVNVDDNGAPSAGGSGVSTGWVLEDNTGPSFHLNGLGGAANVPAHTIIGPPAA